MCTLQRQVVHYPVCFEDTELREHTQCRPRASDLGAPLPLGFLGNTPGPGHSAHEGCHPECHFTRGSTVVLDFLIFSLEQLDCCLPCEDV